MALILHGTREWSPPRLTLRDKARLLHRASGVVAAFMQKGVGGAAMRTPMTGQLGRNCRRRSHDLDAGHVAIAVRRWIRLRYGYQRCLGESLGIAAALIAWGRDAQVVVGHAGHWTGPTTATPSMHAWVTLPDGLVAERPNLCEAYVPVGLYVPVVDRRS